MKLLTPYKIGNVEIKNRLVMTPMNVALGDETKITNEKFVAYYEERAKNGVGLIIPAPYAFMDDGLCAHTLPGGASLCVPGGVGSVKTLIDRVHAQGSKICIQLMHPGAEGESRMNNGQQPVAPSAIKEADFLELPKALTIDEIHIIRDRFIEAAKKMYDIGADGVEVHGAHGYLLYSFMAERMNKRTDEYGGSFENRMRLMKEIAEGVNKIKPENAFLSIRMNGYDFLEDGIQIKDGVEIAKYLEKVGFDVLDVSCGTYSSIPAITEEYLQPEGYRAFFVKEITKAVNIPVIAVNNIKRPETAERLLQENVSDFVAMSRGLVADPAFLSKTAAGKPELIHNCLNCLYCQTQVQQGIDITCAMNPWAGRETIYNDNTLKKDGNGRKVVVIGGGPAGIIATLVAAKRGFSVTLIDKDDQLSGSMRLASQGEGKWKFTTSINGYLNEMKEYDNIEVRLNTEITSAEQITSMNPYAVIVAAGAAPFAPPIPGADKPHVMKAHDVLRNRPYKSGKKVIVVGSGMTGLEATEMFLGAGNQISVYEMMDTIAMGANPNNRAVLLQALAEKGVSFHVQHKLKAINDKTVVFEDLTIGKEVTVDADVVVLSLGVKPRTELKDMLTGKIEKLFFVGDCNGGTLIPHATAAGLEAAWNM